MKILRALVAFLILSGITAAYGQTDEMSYNIVENPVHIHDLHATILHQLGMDPEKLAFKYQGLDQRLMGVEPAKVVTAPPGLISRIVLLTVSAT